MKYVVRHITTYTYNDDVSDSLGVATLTPRALAWQKVAGTELEITPTPADLGHDIDCYGNHTTYFQVLEPHRELVISTSTEVDVVAPTLGPEVGSQPWEQCRPLAAGTTDSAAWQAVDFALPSGSVQLEPEAEEYGAVSLTPGRAVREAALDLMTRIHRDFDYDSTATTVTSTVADTLKERAGVCQDFAHLALACLRSHGVAARYVSGYLATRPPPGKERVVGADASHAWLEVWMGGNAWLAIDPTNDQAVNDRYVTVAWGRDYGDLPPVKGIIFTDATKSTMRVSVDVAPVDQPAQPVG